VLAKDTAVQNALLVDPSLAKTMKIIQDHCIDIEVDTVSVFHNRGDVLLVLRVQLNHNAESCWECEFKLGMSEWTGTVHATVLDLKHEADKWARYEDLGPM